MTPIDVRRSVYRLFAAIHSFAAGVAILFPLAMIVILSAGNVAAADSTATNGAAKDQTAKDPGGEFFERRIRPILEARCYSCHSVDSDEAKGSLLLDSRVAALKGGDTGPALVPGDPKESLLMKGVRWQDKDFQMPPKKKLSDAEIADLAEWIKMSAPWPGGDQPAVRGAVTARKFREQAATHWAFQPLASPTVPADAHPIDFFVRAKLQAKGLRPSPPAARGELIRRVFFDLLGLPPSPEEIEAFERDNSPDAYDKLVDRLLASPHYGERWGRHWLDIVRFTESQGFEYDRLRPNAWPYRDYVIQSFNDDKPYDQFMREQIAGDVVQPVRGEGVIAASMLVCGAYDQAGNSQSNATQREITREEELEDLLSVVGQSFLGLTINCSRCHDHKFDPVSMTDYYRIKSVFDGVKHGDRPIDDADRKPLDTRVAGLNKEIAAEQSKIERLEEEGRKKALASGETPRREVGPTPLARWVFDGPNQRDLSGQTIGDATIGNGVLRISKPGSYFQTKPLSRDVREKTLEAWVALDNLTQSGGGVISIETDDGRIFDAIVFAEQQPKKWMAGSDNFRRTRGVDGPDETAAGGEFVHLAITYGADNRITLYRNGEPYGKSYLSASPLHTFPAANSHILLGLRHRGGGAANLSGRIKQASLYDRALNEREVAASYRAFGNFISRAEIVANLNETQRAEHAAATAKMKSLRDTIDTLSKPPAPRVAYAGTRVQPKPTRLLKRGSVKNPGEVVSPGALSAISALSADFGLSAESPEAQRRVKFAEWLADRRNPLPSRVMANRIWHYHFGQGIVATPSDFGANGAAPSHPELLEFLAGKLLESGWRVKPLHRLIVTSAVYRQASRFEPEAAAKDADNTLLWRYAPRRLEAEAVRDAMLAVSGQLNPRIGGPSFQPFTVTEFNASFYHPIDKGSPEFNRRTVYRMNVNSGKDPLLDSLDCPDPSVKIPRRGVTTTPLQALSLMNGTFVQRQADFLAERATKLADGDQKKAIQTAYRLTLGRLPSEEEAQRADEAAKARGLKSVCWVLLNSTEFSYVR